MSVPTQREQTGPDTGVQVILARLEGKVDAALARQGAQLDGHAAEIGDHETRLRTIEAKVPDRLPDRLQKVETRSTVSWRQLWSAVGSAAALFAVISPLLDRLYSLHP